MKLSKKKKEDFTLTQPRSTRWKMLATLCFITTAASVGFFGLAPLSTWIINDLAITKGQFGILSMGVAIAGIPITIIAGVFVDRIGVRRSIILSLGIMGIFFTGFFLHQTYALAFCLLLLAGVGYSALTPLANIGVVEWFPPNERGMALGFKQSGVPLGVALGGMILPTLGYYWGWQTALGLVGIAILGTALIGYTLYRQGPFSTRAGINQAAKSTHSPSPFKLLLRRDMLWLSLLGVSVCMIQNAFIAFSVQYLNTDIGVSVIFSGYLLSISQISGVIIRPIAGFISDRAFGGNRKIVMQLIALFSALGILILGLIQPGISSFWLFLIMIFVGLCTSSWAGPFFALCVEQVEPHLQGAVNGISSTVLKLGGLMGPPLFGLLVDLFESFTYSWYIFAGWQVFALALFSLFFVYKM